MRHPLYVSTTASEEVFFIIFRILEQTLLLVWGLVNFFEDFDVSLVLNNMYLMPEYGQYARNM